MNVEQILDEFGIKYERITEYYKVLCPFHDDTHPSGNIHHKTHWFHCFACPKKCSFANYLAKYSNLPIYQIKRKLGVRTDVKNPILVEDIERAHNAIWDHPSFLHELHKRCITDEIIRLRRLGVWDNGMEKRISIPILNEIGEYANIRLYLPGAKDKKFINMSGKDRSRIRFTPVDQLEYDQILICPGELKAYAAADVLNKYDIGAIAPTCSEKDWPNDLNDRLYGKLLWINGDIDETGQRYAEMRCRILKSVGREIHKVLFTPEQVGGEPKGDINDFLRHGGDLYDLLLKSPEWILIPGGQLVDETPQPVSFREAYAADNVGKKVQFVGVISAVNGNDFYAPAVVEVRCPRDQGYCTICDVNSQAVQKMLHAKESPGTPADALNFLSSTDMSIGREHPALLAIIGERKDDHVKVYKECFHIPHICRACTFHPKQNYSLTEIRLDEPVEPTSRIEPISLKIAYVVNGPVSYDSQTYNLIGRAYPFPKNQIAAHLISHCEPTADALDSYIPPDSSYFYQFRPKEWTLTSLEQKLDEIYSDLEANVTHIWQRRDYHIALDLAYHSVLYFDFGEMKNVNAWVEFLAVGDTSQGKSQVFKEFRGHYGLGHKIDCKSATPAGLIIGLEKGHGKHFAIYGAFPRNDRGLIILEELKGMDPKTFQQLTEVRSSGYVQITKVQQKIRYARCRIIAITNPPDIREVASYTYGIDSALGVIGTNEDLRRFDIVLVLGKNDIKSLPELENPPTSPHIFTDEQCQKLILKAWKCEEVEFEDINYILEVTKRLVGIFGDGLPILDTNSSHIKIAKLSAALAARTASFEDIYNQVSKKPSFKLIVRRCHVEFIEQYLHRIYSSPSARLDEKSKAIRSSYLLRDRDSLVQYLKGMNNSADIMKKIEESDTIDSGFIKDLVGDPFQGATLFAKLIQSNAIQMVRKGKYSKTPEFTRLLKDVDFQSRKPDYLRNKESP